MVVTSCSDYSMIIAIARFPMMALRPSQRVYDAGIFLAPALWLVEFQGLGLKKTLHLPGPQQYVR